MEEITEVQDKLRELKEKRRKNDPRMKSISDAFLGTFII